jgi:cytochrome c oxidase subunit II
VQSQLPLYPEQASNFAPLVDGLMIFITSVCVFFAAAITLAIIYFFFKYHRKAPDAVGVPIHGDSRLEAAWIIVPLILAMVMFSWGAVIYVDYRHTPSDTLDIYVVGKQWMWKVQQPNGLKEINELHVPVGRNIRLTLASEDVIHDFFVPAFRVKMDVIPGNNHYNTMWFRPTKAGRYHFFCSQYCGTNHALMSGWVIVMEPTEYAAWLSGSGAGEANPVTAGEKLFAEKACATCHVANGSGRAPSLNGLYGAKVLLADGTTVIADEAYIRESIVQPNEKIVAGYQPLMPTFQGQLTEEQIIALNAYIKSLQSQPVPAKGSGVAPASSAETAPATEKR